MSSFSKWMNGDYYLLPPNGSVVFDIDSAWPVLSNTFQVFYLQEPAASTFKVEVAPSVGGQPYTSTTTGYIAIGGTFNAQGAAEAGAVVSGTAPLNSYQLKVTCLTGTLNLIGAEMVNSTVNGVVFGNFSKGGIGGQVSNMVTGTNIIAPIVAACAPDLYLFSTANDANTIASYLPGTLAELNSAYPNSDWVLVGPHPFDDAVPVGGGTNNNYDANTVACMTAERAIAVQNDYTFVDGYTIFSNYAAALASGMITTASMPHLTPVGDRIQELNVIRVTKLNTLIGF